MGQVETEVARMKNVEGKKFSTARMLLSRSVIFDFDAHLMQCLPGQEIF